MLLLMLSADDTEGTCRINGREADYRLGFDFLEFRYSGDSGWQRRSVLGVAPSMEDGRAVMTLMCE